MSTLKIVGIDLSVTETGFAVGVGGAYPELGVIQPKAKGIMRLAEIRDRIAALVDGADLVVIEGYSYHSATNAVTAGEVGGVIRLMLTEREVFYIEVAPTTLKSYATGTGKGKKAGVLVAAGLRLGYAGANDNEADALWLYAMGADSRGMPLVDLPQTHRRALHALAL